MCKNVCCKNVLCRENITVGMTINSGAHSLFACFVFNLARATAQCAIQCDPNQVA